MEQYGTVWMNQTQLAELFYNSVPNISMHISNILEEKELQEKSVIKDYLTTATDGKSYSVTFYSLEMILAIAFILTNKALALQINQWQKNINTIFCAILPFTPMWCSRMTGQVSAG